MRPVSLPPAALPNPRPAMNSEMTIAAIGALTPKLAMARRSQVT